MGGRSGAPPTTGWRVRAALFNDSNQPDCVSVGGDARFESDDTGRAGFLRLVKGSNSGWIAIKPGSALTHGFSASFQVRLNGGKLSFGYGRENPEARDILWGESSTAGVYWNLKPKSSSLEAASDVYSSLCYNSGTRLYLSQQTPFSAAQAAGSSQWCSVSIRFDPQRGVSVIAGNVLLHNSLEGWGPGSSGRTTDVWQETKKSETDAAATAVAEETLALDDPSGSHGGSPLFAPEYDWVFMLGATGGAFNADVCVRFLELQELGNMQIEISRLGVGGQVPRGTISKHMVAGPDDGRCLYTFVVSSETSEPVLLPSQFFRYDVEHAMWHPFVAWGEFPRACHPDRCAVTFSSEHRAIFFFLSAVGGTGSTLSSGVFMLDVDTGEWTRLNTVGLYPPSDIEPAIAVSGTSLIMYGGGLKGSGIYQLDINTATWSQPIVHGLAPLPRTHYTSLYTDGVFWVIGGVDAEQDHGPHRKCLNDVHQLVQVGATWTWRKPDVTGHPPPPRALATAVSDGTVYYVLGGVRSAPGLDWPDRPGRHEPSATFDCYCLDPLAMCWSPVYTSPPGGVDRVNLGGVGVAAYPVGPGKIVCVCSSPNTDGQTTFLVQIFNGPSDHYGSNLRSRESRSKSRPSKKITTPRKNSKRPHSARMPPKTSKGSRQQRPWSARSSAPDVTPAPPEKPRSRPQSAHVRPPSERLLRPFKRGEEAETSRPTERPQSAKMNAESMSAHLKRLTRPKSASAAVETNKCTCATTDGPGPGAYEAPTGFVNIGIKFGHEQQRGRRNKEAELVPGPGQYPVFDSFGKRSGKFDRGNRPALQGNATRDVPGPGRYEAPGTFSKVGTVLGKERRIPKPTSQGRSPGPIYYPVAPEYANRSTKFPVARRMPEGQDATIGPGPAKYDCSQKKPETPLYSFGSETRKSGAKANAGKYPGPGQYNMPSAKGLSYSFGLGTANKLPDHAMKEKNRNELYAIAKYAGIAS
eukprot:Rmarinus@m.12208